jgi:hypothetical protein
MHRSTINTSKPMPESPMYTVKQSPRVSYISQTTERTRRRAILSAASGSKGLTSGGAVIYEAIIKTHDLKKFFDRVKILPS